MEFAVTPAGFNIARIPAVGPDGQTGDTVTKLLVVDLSGIVTSVMFPNEVSWQEFQRYVADPEGETARQQARAKIVQGMAPNIRGNGGQPS